MKRTAAAIACSILAGCGKVASPALPPDAGPSQPTVEDVDPAPGAIAASARCTVRFSAAMDEGQLLAPSGRSESVVLAAEADVERAAAAIEHAPLSAHERTLLVPAEAGVASDRRSILLAPDSPLLPGEYYLLVSPRLKDEQGAWPGTAPDSRFMSRHRLRPRGCSRRPPAARFPGTSR